MTETPKTRISLILRLQSEQDAIAWHQFVEIYEPFISQLARRKGLQAADAADVTQEVLSKIVVAINRYEANVTRSSFRGWIATIARNTIIDFLRKDARQTKASGDSAIRNRLAEIPDPAQVEIFFDAKYQQRLFQWAAQHAKSDFREKTWQAFWRTSVQSETPSTVANQLGISVGAVYIAKSRVLAKIKTVISQSGFDLTDDHSIETKPNSQDGGKQ